MEPIPELDELLVNEELDQNKENEDNTNEAPVNNSSVENEEKPVEILDDERETSESNVTDLTNEETEEKLVSNDNELVNFSDELPVQETEIEVSPPSGQISSVSEISEIPEEINTNTEVSVSSPLTEETETNISESIDNEIQDANTNESTGNQSIETTSINPFNNEQNKLTENQESSLQEEVDNSIILNPFSPSEEDSARHADVSQEEIRELAGEVQYNRIGAGEVLQSSRDVYADSSEKVQEMSVTKIRRKSRYRFVILAVVVAVIFIIFLGIRIWSIFNSPDAKAERKLLNNYCNFYRKKDIKYLKKYLNDEELKRHQKALDIIKENNYNIQCSYNYKDNSFDEDELQKLNSCLKTDLAKASIMHIRLNIKSLPKGDVSKTDTYLIYGISDRKYKIYEVTNVFASGYSEHKKQCSYLLNIETKEGTL